MKSLFLNPAPAIYNEVRHDGKKMNFRPWVRALIFLGQYAAAFLGWVAFTYVILSLPSPM